MFLNTETQRAQRSDRCVSVFKNDSRESLEAVIELKFGSYGVHVLAQDPKLQVIS